MNNFKFAYATTNDINDIITLMKNEFPKFTLEKSIYGTNKINQYLKLSITEKYSNKKRIVCKSRNRIIGYIEGICNKDKFHINYIAVDSEFRRKNIGKRLVENIIKSLDKGINKISIHVYKHNFNALNWYLKLGFKIINEKNIFEITTDSTIENSCKDIFILNYPQFKIEYENFEFSYLKIQFKSEEFLIGVLGARYFRVNNVELLNNSKIIGFLNSIDSNRKIIISSEYKFNFNENISEVKFIGKNYYLEIDKDSLIEKL